MTDRSKSFVPGLYRNREPPVAEVDQEIERDDGEEDVAPNTTTTTVTVTTTATTTTTTTDQAGEPGILLLPMPDSSPEANRTLGDLIKGKRQPRTRKPKVTSKESTPSPAGGDGAATANFVEAGPAVTAAPAVNAVQFRLGLDGAIGLDQQSLVITRPGHVAERANDIRQDVTKIHITARTYMPANKKRKTIKWSEAETAEFYVLLRKWGTNFELIAANIDGRTRADVRNKFNREDRQFSSKITDALNRKPPP